MSNFTLVFLIYSGLFTVLIYLDPYITALYTDASVLVGITVSFIPLFRKKFKVYIITLVILSVLTGVSLFLHHSYNIYILKDGYLLWVIFIAFIIFAVYILPGMLSGNKNRNNNY